MRHLISSKISLLGRLPAATTQPCNYFFSWTSSTALLSRCSSTLQQPSSPVSAADPQQLPPPGLMLPEIKGRATGTTINHHFNLLMRNNGGSCLVVVPDDAHCLSCSHGWVPFASLGDCGLYPFPSLPNVQANVIPNESGAAESMENFVNWTQSFPIPQLPLESIEPNLPEDMLSPPTVSDLQLMEEEGFDDAAILAEAVMGTSLAKIPFEIVSPLVHLVIAPGMAMTMIFDRSSPGLQLASKVYPKHHRGRMKGTSHQGNEVSFGRFGLQALEPAWITARQIEAGRRAMVRNAPRSAKIWVRVFPDKPVTAKPTEVRMGKGKGAPSHTVAVVKPGRILYEIGLVAENTARKAVEIAASKLPIQSRFVISA